MSDPDDYTELEMATHEREMYEAKAREMQVRHQQNITSGMMGVGSAAIGASATFAMGIGLFLALLAVFR